MSNCPCCSGRDFADCCEPYIKGEAKPATAEALMRARYTAHVTHNLDFVWATNDPAKAEEMDPETTRRWAEESEWLGLDIRQTEKGGEGDDEGMVEFVCEYRDKQGRRHQHHELSLFKKLDGEWRFHDAAAPKVEQVRRNQPKVGRNDPCPCGSGKKYKKCCGAA
jgi:SEC-C motif-containing protein